MSDVTGKEYLLPPGTILDGRYRIEKVIGEGGFGITYEAVNEKIDMTVAIKEFYCREYINRDVTRSNAIYITYGDTRDDFEKAKRRFLQEAKTLSGFSEEQAIVNILDYFEENGTAYIVMNYLHGITLDQYLFQNGPMGWKEMLEKFKPLITTLERVHNRGVIHRDISASNIMVLENGSLCLLDFGSAKDTFRNGQKTTTVFTKQGYTPLEQYAQDGNVGAWTDVYALTAVCYECLSVMRPPDSLQRSVYDEYKSLKSWGIKVPSGLEQMLRKGLAVKVEQRYANMGELLSAIQALSPEKKQKKRRIAVIAVLLVFLAVSAASIYYYQAHREEIYFRYEETETFCLVRGKGVSADDFEADYKKIKERMRIISGQEPYLCEKTGDTIRCVALLEVFGMENPTAIIQDLIARPCKWSIGGVEIEQRYITDIRFVDSTKQEVEIILAAETPLEIQQELSAVSESGTVNLVMDVSHSDHFVLEGQVNSALSYKWKLPDAWKNENIRDLFLYNLRNTALCLEFRTYLQLQADWESRKQGDIFGEKQCESDELGKNTVTLEYGGAADQEITEGNITDFVTVLKRRLDLLDIAYAVGSKKGQVLRIMIRVRQKDYHEDLFGLLGKQKSDLSIRDAWGNSLADGFFIQDIGNEKTEATEGSVLVETVDSDASMAEIQNNVKGMVAKNISSYYLMVDDIRLLCEKLDDERLAEMDQGNFWFSTIKMGDGKLRGDNEKIVQLLKDILATDSGILNKNCVVVNRQYSDKKEIVAVKAVESNEKYSFDRTEEEGIIQKIQNLSKDYRVSSDIDCETGEERLQVTLSKEVYAETISDSSIVLEQIQGIMETCNMEKGTPWSDITIAIMSRYTEGKFAGKIIFSHLSFSDATMPYTISVYGYEEKETAWLREISELMKTDEKFQGYEIMYTDASEILSY